MFSKTSLLICHLLVDLVWRLLMMYFQSLILQQLCHKLKLSWLVILSFNMTNTILRNGIKNNLSLSTDYRSYFKVPWGPPEGAWLEKQEVTNHNINWCPHSEQVVCVCVFWCTVIFSLVCIIWLHIFCCHLLVFVINVLWSFCKASLLLLTSVCLAQ